MDTYYRMVNCFVLFVGVCVCVCVCVRVCVRAKNAVVFRVCVWLFYNT